MYFNNMNNKPCPCKIVPIVCPERVVCVHCTYCYDQPVVIPVRTHVVNHWVPRYTYQVSRTTSEESICPGNMNMNPNQQ